MLIDIHCLFHGQNAPYLDDQTQIGIATADPGRGNDRTRTHACETRSRHRQVSGGQTQTHWFQFLNG
jgi:hypothetical protein